MVGRLIAIQPHSIWRCSWQRHQMLKSGSRIIMALWKTWGTIGTAVLHRYGYQLVTIFFSSQSYCSSASSIIAALKWLATLSASRKVNSPKWEGFWIHCSAFWHSLMRGERCRRRLAPLQRNGGGISGGWGDRSVTYAKAHFVSTFSLSCAFNLFFSTQNIKLG